MAAATTQPVAETAAGAEIDPASESVVELVTEPVVEEVVAEAPPAPEAEPITESAGDVDGEGEAQAADDPGEPTSGPAGDGWQPILFR